jgi:Tfp pilus assembly protein PilN
MDTTIVNLVPRDRREARRGRIRAYRWARVCGIYAVLLVAACAAARVTLESDDHSLRDEAARLDARVEQTGTIMTNLRHDYDQVTAQLEANRAVGRQPDWSVLLALLAHTLGDEVVLRQVKVEASSRKVDADSGPTPTGPGPIEESEQTPTMAVSGIGRTQQSISRFVLRLEQTALFQSVKLIRTQRQQFLTDHAVSFEIRCIFVNAEGGG